MVARHGLAEEKGPSEEGFQAAAASVTTAPGARMEERARLLAFWARTIADWADRMPLRDVYIFGDCGGDELPLPGKLKIAIEYGENGSDEMMRRWQHENATDFVALEKALGVDIQVFTDQDYGVWAPIRDAARVPLMTVRKVRVVQIAERAP
jgi:hypothetical protein